ncbi:corticoliberin precursor [Silurus asotus]|uniref:Corticoliberin n=1 Tax=Silurus asotus TaxID=30991 RepID=A0AAD5B5Q3_SILAS|nr:corticoliberin precursor [Silurus asotus]
MKRYVLFALVAMLCTFIPCNKCKAIASFKDELTGFRLTEQQRPVLPILIRLGEQYFIRLDNPKQSLFQEDVDELGNVLTDNFIQLPDSERKRRGDEPPISLDLTFHLLREVLEMARAEQLAQQANNNRKIMDFFGK